MTTHTLTDIRIILKNDTASNWQTENPILLAAELGYERDTGLFKFGDGIRRWNDIAHASQKPAETGTTNPGPNDDDYPIGTIFINTTTNNIYILVENTAGDAKWEQLVTMSELLTLINNLGGGNMLREEFAVGGIAGVVDRATQADRLATARDITLTGDVQSTPVSFNGSQSVSLATALQNVVAAGTYPMVTVNAKGLVVGFETHLSLSHITDAGTAASRNVGTNPGNVVIVENDGYINSSLIGAIHLVNIHTVSTIPAKLALSATQGDIAIVSLATGDQVYILRQTPATVQTNWVRLNVPTGAILSINGLSGASVTLTTTNIAEGTNQYYTEARATANFGTNIPLTPSTQLQDGNSILRSTDRFVLNGGNATLA